MRISDWSSDVCSSDLSPHRTAVRTEANRTVDATLTRFEQQGFDLTDYRSSGGQLEVPRIFLAKLPVDMADVSITDKRKIGRASCRERGCQPCRSRWSPDI